MPAACGIFTQPEILYVLPAVKLLTVWRIFALAPLLEVKRPAKPPLCATVLLRVKIAFAVQLSGRPSLFASISNPGFCRRLPEGGRLVGVRVGVDARVAVDVGVRVGVEGTAGVPVEVLVGVLVGPGVRVAVAVGVGVEVGVPAAPPATFRINWGALLPCLEE